jgi:hypothetical protein
MTTGHRYISRFGEEIEPLPGREQLVFDWSEDHCEADPFHIPDAPARAFRDTSGRVQVILASRHTRRLVGPELDEVSVEPGFRVILESHGSDDHASYDNLEWITATHTDDGETVHALVHNEYHGWEHSADCSSERACWLNTVTLATSTDGGASYTHRPAPSHAVATFPYRYAPNTGPMGFFMPSNIVERDGWHYALVRALNGPRESPAYPEQVRGNCLIRTADLGEPASWRAWDGAGFGVAFADPYRDRVEPREHVCRPVSIDPLRELGPQSPSAYTAGEMTESLTYNSHFGRYLLTGISWKPDERSGEDVWGIYYSLSADLVEWSERRLLAEVHPYYVPVTDPGRPHSVLYPAVLDPASADRNFGTTGRVNDLYFTVYHYRVTRDRRLEVDGKNRDLVKLRFAFA